MRWRFLLTTILYFGLVLDMHFANGGWKQNWELGNISVMLLSYVFLISMFLLVDVSLPGKTARWINAFLAMIYTLLAYYQTNTGSSLDFAIIANNWQAATNADGVVQFGKLLHNIFVAANVFWSLVAGLLIFFSYRREVSPERKSRFKRPLQAAFTLLGLLLITQVSYSHDQFSRFGRSLYRWYVPMHTVLNEYVEKLPLLPRVQVQSQFTAASKPHVFLVMIESFNGRFIHQRHTNGEEYTPYFNALTKEHVYIPEYYSPSVQTGKGHFAALCGQVPSLNNIEFRSTACAKLKCLPSYFKEYGYKTFFAQAHGDMGFDNERVFLLNHGLDEYPQLAKSCSEETDPCHGWGLQDDYFYRRALTYLEKNYSPSEPLFATLATISSHQPFTGLPVKLRHFYQEPKDRREAYINHLKVIDDSLKVLIEELKKSPFGKNAVLVITGDHGFPLGEHGSSHNENFAFNENFKVPLLIVDLRQVATKRPQGAFSHINLPATLLDLAGWSGELEMVGRSVFDPQFTEKGDAVYLVQPYSGGYVAAIRWPYKYIFERSRLGESVYDLSQDPEERTNLFARTNPEVMAGLRESAAQILRQQEVLLCR
ncbi:MAG: LTA synthase family protein [Bdellovibrionaceae bacterium]|nr:LTA synthase family protein [Pseudobdellovibrionaceae bacterium]